MKPTLTRNWRQKDPTGKIAALPLPPIYNEPAEELTQTDYVEVPSHSKNALQLQTDCIMVMQHWSALPDGSKIHPVNLGDYFAEAVILINLKKSKKASLRLLTETLNRQQIGVKTVICI